MGVGVLSRILLQLNDEGLEGHGGEFLALGLVEVDVGCFEGCGEVGVGEGAAGGAVADLHVWAGGDDAVFEAFELDLHLNAVELE